MKSALVPLLRCPACRGSLALSTTSEVGGEIESGSLRCAACGREFPVIDSIPRFVDGRNYAGTFGFQWNHFRRTQLDSSTGVPISRRRFLDATGWDPASVAGKRVLDAGCGAGRFAEVALSLGAEVVAIDYSSAVDAAWKNLSPHPRLHVLQADIYALPFAPGTFDYVYSLGVVQHTPDVKRAVLSLPPLARPGGSLVVDCYQKNAGSLFHAKFWLRPLTRHIRPDLLFRIIQRTAPFLLAISRMVRAVPLAGRPLSRLVPVANYAGVLPLNRQQLLEWAVLDTFDWFSPRYDQPQTAATLRAWLEEAGLVGIDVRRAHHLTGRGSRPMNAE